MTMFTYSARVGSAALCVGWAAGCTSSPEIEAPAQLDSDAVVEAPIPEPVPVSVSAWPVKPAWPLGEGRVWVPGPGRLLTPGGIVVVDGGEPCGDGLAFATDAHPVGWLPAGEAVTFPDAPAMQAATVERVSWRLAEVLGPQTGLVPGGRTEADPALHQGLEVRSVRKTRRQGAPVLVALGDRAGKVGVVIVDKEAGKILAQDLIDLGEPPWAVPALVPVQDYDGDGTSELIVWGDVPSEPGQLRSGFRALYRVDLGNKPSMALVGIERTDGKVCGALPSGEPKSP